MKEMLVGFLLGAATGSAGGYFAAKYTDQRREKELAAKEKRKFQEIVNLMPDITQELGSLLSQPGTSLVRELVVLANRNIVFNQPKKCFLLFADRYKDLTGKISILENYGYVTGVSKNGAEVYRMTEEFVGLVRSASKAAI